MPEHYSCRRTGSYNCRCTKASIGFDNEGRVTVGFPWIVEDPALVAQLESSNDLAAWSVLEIDLVAGNGRLTTMLEADVVQDFLRMQVTLAP